MDLGDCTETISVKHKTGITKSGDPLYGSLVLMQAKIERGSRTQVGQEGDELDDTSMLFTIDKLAASDMVWFPEDDTSSAEAAHRVVVCAELRDLDGRIDHYETSF